MKHWVELICYSEGGKSVYRSQFDLPNITPEEFNPSVHMGRLFDFPEITEGSYLSKTPFVKIWKVATPETKEEEDILVAMGKWQSNSLPILNQ